MKRFANFWSIALLVASIAALPHVEWATYFLVASAYLKWLAVRIEQLQAPSALDSEQTGFVEHGPRSEAFNNHLKSVHLLLAMRQIVHAESLASAQRTARAAIEGAEVL